MPAAALGVVWSDANFTSPRSLREWKIAVHQWKKCAKLPYLKRRASTHAFIKLSSEAPLLLIWLVYTCITRVAPSIPVHCWFFFVFNANRRAALKGFRNKIHLFTLRAKLPLTWIAKCLAPRLTGVAAICILNSTGCAGNDECAFLYCTILWCFFHLLASDGGCCRLMENSSRRGATVSICGQSERAQFCILHCTLRFVPR